MLTLSEIVYHTKHCSKCDQVKTRDEFRSDTRSRTGLHSWCRQCHRNSTNEHIKTDHGRQKQEDYKKSDHGRLMRSKSRKEKWTTDPKYKMTEILRKRLRNALKRARHRKAVKCASTLHMLGCSIDEFIKHIEQQFQPGMSWQNHGVWHIDHVLPCASFDLTDPEQQKTCFNFSNMQPLWAKDNISKGCRLNVQHANTV